MTAVVLRLFFSRGKHQQFQPLVKPFRMFSHQTKLPRLPVPPLERTLQKYQNTLIPLINAKEQLTRVEAEIKNFASGLGPVLQRRLLDHQFIEPENWLDQWWYQKAYLEWREPLVVNSNWYMLLRDDPVTQKELEIDRGFRPLGEYSPVQIKRAAVVLSGFLDAFDLIRSESWPVEQTKEGPLCMWQYSHVFGITRIPKPQCDVIAGVGGKKSTSRHVVISAKNRFYKLEVYDQDDNRISTPQLEEALWKIVNHAKSQTPAPPVGVMTADHRDEWAVNRQALVDSSSLNLESLHEIESSLIALELDDHACEDNPDLWHRHVFHGGNGHNRWFDKSLTIVVQSNSRVGIHGEHSPCDALICSYIFDHVLKKQVDQPTTTFQDSSPALFKPLQFDLDESALERIAAAQKRVDAVIANSDSVVLYHYDYGTSFAKKMSISPDAYMQMALQLAYYRIHGKSTATYETASTRKFLRGRTECTRTLSVKSQEWTRLMQNPAATFADKYQALQTAATAHVQYAKEASNGHGIDRHLLGLQLVLQPNEGDPFFANPLFKESKTWRLSTSGLGTNSADYITGCGFGAATEDGYGINYLTNGDMVRFSIESKRSCPETDSANFRRVLVQVLADMRKVCEEATGIRWPRL